MDGAAEVKEIREFRICSFVSKPVALALISLRFICPRQQNERASEGKKESYCGDSKQQDR